MQAKSVDYKYCILLAAETLKKAHTVELCGHNLKITLAPEFLPMRPGPTIIRPRKREVWGAGGEKNVDRQASVSLSTFPKP